MNRSLFDQQTRMVCHVTVVAGKRELPVCDQHLFLFVKSIFGGGKTRPNRLKQIFDYPRISIKDFLPSRCQNILETLFFSTFYGVIQILNSVNLIVKSFKICTKLHRTKLHCLNPIFMDTFKLS